MYDWGAHAPRVLVIANFSPAKSLSYVAQRPRDFGEGAEMSTRGRVRSPESIHPVIIASRARENTPLRLA
jgi:hypothetical protein